MNIFDAIKANVHSAVKCKGYLDNIVFAPGKMADQTFVPREILAEWEVVPERETISVKEAIEIVSSFAPFQSECTLGRITKELKYYKDAE
jgi:hypothetical protein